MIFRRGGSGWSECFTKGKSCEKPGDLRQVWTWSLLVCTLRLNHTGPQVNGDDNVNPILNTNILKGKQLIKYFQYSSYEFPAVFK